MISSFNSLLSCGPVVVPPCTQQGVRMTAAGSAQRAHFQEILTFTESVLVMDLGKSISSHTQA